MPSLLELATGRGSVPVAGPLPARLAGTLQALSDWFAPARREGSPEERYVRASQMARRGAGMVAPGASATVTEENMPEGPLGKLALAGAIATAPQMLVPATYIKDEALGVLGSTVGGRVGQALGGDLGGTIGSIVGAVGSGFAPDDVSRIKTAIPEIGKMSSVGETVDGLRVRSEVPNLDSIPASLGSEVNYKVHRGVKEVPLSTFDVTSPYDLYYAKNDIDWTKELADKIKNSGEINPLIVVKDAEGYYVLEGGHRLGALSLLGKKSLPAVVVEDLTP